MTSSSAFAQEGDVAQIVGVKHKSHMIRLQAGRTLQTHRGEIKHDDLIGLPWGSIIRSHIGRTFHMLEPSIADIINNLPRRTQILYPKDIGYILITMGIGPGKRVGEAGSGSGGMTLALSNAVGPGGHVYSYESHPDTMILAKKNLRLWGHPERVTFKERDITSGMDETGLDAFFLDVPNQYDLIGKVREVLKPGGAFCCLAPTTNQVSKTLEALEEHKFAFIEVCEIFLRFYRSKAHRLRPVDRMVAHTGYLIFGRPVVEPPDENEK